MISIMCSIVSQHNSKIALLCVPPFVLRAIGRLHAILKGKGTVERQLCIRTKTVCCVAGRGHNCTRAQLRGGFALGAKTVCAVLQGKGSIVHS